MTMQSYLEQWQSWATTMGVVLGGMLAALVGHTLLYRLLARIARRSATAADDELIHYTMGPTRLLAPLVVAAGLLDGAGPLSRGLVLLHQIAVIGVIGAAAWTVIGLIGAVGAIIGNRYRTDLTDNLEARRIRTQVELLQRVAIGLVCIVALATALMSFPSVRQVGLSLFASAGVAGLVLGMAARPTLGNMIAGVQIALAQPIRLDDVVVLDGEFGRVEEINATYVVLKLWDERRMVVPLTRFIEEPFTNWTHTSSSLLATVMVYADYQVDLEAVRAELRRIVDGHQLWDRRVALLQVTDATEQAIQLRALVSASNSGAAWDLRCDVREALIAFLRRQPGALPRVRAAVEHATGRVETAV
jgi:small-conductance mechanosensitive channel